MKSILKYALITIITVLCIISCGGSKNSYTEMSPEAVEESFNKALASGDFEKVSGLCDTVSMKPYLENYINVWKEIQEKDSSALAIASSILSEAVLTIERSEKTEAGRAVYYRIGTEEKSKRKIAVLKKEEGEWRVETITDVI